MFVTDANAGDVRLNFSTQMDVVEAVNKRARALGCPVVSSPVSMGGYRYPILEDLADERHFQILKSRTPATDRHRAELRAAVRSSDTVYSYIDAASITIVQIEGWDETLKDHGIRVRAGQKTFKRLKQLNRPFRLYSRPEGQLVVAVVDDADYTDSEVVHELPPEIRERVLDGAFVIHPRLYEDCLDNISFPTMEGKYMTIDQMRSAMFYRQARRLKVHNARLLGRFKFLSTGSDNPLEGRTGSLKGQAFLDVSDTCDRMGVDVICAASALKEEVSSEKAYVLLDPQSTKYRANGDFQSITNMPALFQTIPTRHWLSSWLMGGFQDLTENRLMESWFNMDSPNYTAQNVRKYDIDDLITMTKWNARGWIMSGLPLKWSAWLFEQMARNLLSVIRTNDPNKMRIPLPCAVRCQVISQSMSSMAGHDIEVLPGQIRWSQAHNVLVVHDDDWIEMYPSHGGNDLDDFFVAFWRTVANQRKVIIMRSPNDYGEYSVFDYVPDDWHPQEEMRNGRVIIFPEIPSDKNLWPKRLSEALADGEITYLGMPSTKTDKTEEEEPHDYGLRDLSKAITNNTYSEVCVGANVNARALASSALGYHRPVQLCPMETAIDTGAQGGSAADIKAVMAEAGEILQEVLNSGKPIDRYIWQTRFENPFRENPFPDSRLVDTHVSQLHDFRLSFAEMFMTKVREYIAEHVGKELDPRIKALAQRRLAVGYELLKNCRHALMASQRNGPATEDTWEDINQYIGTYLDKEPNEAARNDLLIGLWVASLTYPAASTGRISDQLLMNPGMFENLLNALRFYGIAGYLTVNEHGQIQRQVIDRWELSCNGCGKTWTDITDPTTLQRYHANEGLCIDCRK